MTNTNHATNIAIIGASGRSGQHITSALLATGKHKVTVITRHDSNSNSNSNSNNSLSFPSGSPHAVIKVDYTSHSALTTALQDQDALIVTLAVGVDPSVMYRIVDAAIAAHVRFIFPNEWGVDVSGDEALARDAGFLERFRAVREYIETQAKTQQQVQGEARGRTAWIGVACGFWYEFSLAGTEARYGFDFERRKVTFYNDGNLAVNTTTWPQLGRAVAALLALDVDREEGGASPATSGGGDAKPVISDWANRSVRISSFVLTQRDMLDSVLRVTPGVKREDWTVNHENVVERYNRGRTLVQQGKMVGFAIQLYARTFYPPRPGDDRQRREGFDNDRLGLPKEDLDQATRVAVEMAARGETNALD